MRRAFEDFDTDHDGIIALEEIIACLRSKLPPQEVGASPVLVCVILNAAGRKIVCGEAAAAARGCCSVVWSQDIVQVAALPPWGSQDGTVGAQCKYLMWAANL